MEKITRNSLDKEVNFHLHSFMLDMKLSPNETLVYAFIYSFSQNKSGVYYGTQKYLAETLGISVRTVIRVYKKLSEMGLLERYVSSDASVNGIRAVLPKKKKIPDEKQASRREIIESKRPKTAKTPADVEKTLPSIEEKYAPMDIPFSDTLTITPLQYQKLRELVPNDVLYGYIRRFDRYMYRRLQKMEPSPRSHYKVIKSWIEQDLGT